MEPPARSPGTGAVGAMFILWIGNFKGHNERKKNYSAHMGNEISLRPADLRSGGKNRIPHKAVAFPAAGR
jgi:hypothetical protein